MAAKKKATTKRAPKKITSKRSRVSNKRNDDAMIDDTMLVTEEVDIVEFNQSRRSSLINRRNVFIILLLGSFGYLLYLNRGLFVAAMVNNQPISRVSVISELEKRQGKSALDSLVTETLIMQEAQKNNIVVSNEEVDAELNTINENLKAQGQELDQLLSMQGMKKEDLEKQIRVQKVVEKLLNDKLTVSDEEVKKYLTDNKDAFNPDAKPEEKEEQARTQIKQEKLGTEFQTWLTDLKAKSNIRYFVSY